MRSKHARRGDSWVAYAREVREEPAEVLSIDQDRLLEAGSDCTKWRHSIAVAISAVVTAIIEGFAAYALAMHPESLCRSGGRVDRHDAIRAGQAGSSHRDALASRVKRQPDSHGLCRPARHETRDVPFCQPALDPPAKAQVTARLPGPPLSRANQ